MAGAPDAELKPLTGFPAGVNNVAPDYDLPRDQNGVITSLRGAVNVDLVGLRKKPRRRAGYTLKIAGKTHSPASLPGTLFAVADGDLKAYGPELEALGTVRAAVGTRYLSYAEVNGDLYWSSPTEFRCIRGADLADTPGWIDCPGIPNAQPIDGYGMTAGTYRVAMTWFDADGRESGALGVAEVVVAADQGIQVNEIPVAPEGAVKFRLYVSPADGEELYAAGDYLTSVTNTVLGVEAGLDGKALETLWRQPLPPCTILRYWNGRLLGASGNLLVWSDALRVGLATRDNYMRFGQGITLLEPIGLGSESSGVFIADHKHTYWMAGGNPTNWRRVIRYDHPAVPGTSLIVKGTDVGLETTENVVFWLAANGVFCVGLPGGEIKPLTEGRLALPGGESGASVFRETNGLRQMITSFIATGPNALAIGDTASATVTTHTPQ